MDSEFYPGCYSDLELGQNQNLWSHMQIWVVFEIWIHFRSLHLTHL